MADNNVNIRVRLDGARQTSAEAHQVAHAVDDIGDKAAKSDRRVRRASGGFGVLSTRMKIAGGATARFGGVLGGGLAAAAGVAAAGVYGAGKVAVAAAREYTEAARAGAETAAVIKSTGGVANVSQRQVEGLSNALSEKAGIDDEVIQSGENMLLTFKNIRNEAGKGNDIFNQSTNALVDLAAKMGTDPKKAAIQLGKALNDPIKGLTALRRVGVAFSDSQQKQIKRLVDTGHRMEAQKIILRELNSEFGGIAAAHAQPFDKLKVTIANLEESIGRFAAPTVTRGINFVLKFLQQMQSGRGLGGAAVKFLRKAWTGLFNAFKPMAPFLKNDLVPILKLLAITLGIQLVVGLKILTGVIYVVSSAFGFLGKHINLSGPVNSAIKSLQNLYGRLKYIGGQISYFFRDGFWNGMKTGFATAINWVIDQLNRVVGFKIAGHQIGVKIGHVGLPAHKTGGIPTTKLATGGIVRQPGTALIGEHGPEILSLPRAARVDPLPKHGVLSPLGHGVLENHLNVYLDGRQVAASVGRAAMAASNRA